MSVSRIQLIEMAHKAQSASESFTAKVVEWVLHSTDAPGKWPNMDLFDRDILKRLRDGYKGRAYDRLMAYCEAAIDCESVYHEHVLLWEVLPESVRAVFRQENGTSFAQIQDSEGEISRGDVNEALWNYASFCASRMQHATSQHDLTKAVSIAKHEYFPCLRAVTEFGFVEARPPVELVDRHEKDLSAK